MKISFGRVVFVLLLALILGCTAEGGGTGKYRLTCYSQGQLIFDERVTSYRRASDTAIYYWDTNGERGLVTGDCVVR